MTNPSEKVSASLQVRYSVLIPCWIAVAMIVIKSLGILFGLEGLEGLEEEFTFSDIAALSVAVALLGYVRESSRAISELQARPEE